MDVIFLSVEDVVYIQEREAALTNSPTIIRSRDALESAVASPQATFDGQFLMDLFEMAATYVVSIAVNHPFMDGNKRAAAASALVFLSMNGYDVTENHEVELADQVLGYLEKKVSKEQLAEYFRSHSAPSTN
jgi:death-on-curing protein